MCFNSNKGQKMVEYIYTILGSIVVGRVATIESELDSIVLWHMWLDYLGKCVMIEFDKRNILKVVKTCKFYFYKYCVIGK